MQAAPPSVRVGDRMTVEIHLDAAGHEVANAPYHVTFDPAIVRIVSAVEGDFFRSAGATSAFIPSPSPGRLIIGHSQIQSPQSVTGAGTLAIVTLEGLAPGETTLTFEHVSLADRTNDAVPTQASNLLVTVTR